MLVKSRLIGFGDSWSYGSELAKDQKPFVEILSQQLGCVESANYSRPGSSIGHLPVQLNSHISRITATRQHCHEWMAIFFLTGQDRSMTYVDTDWMFQTPNGGFCSPGQDKHLASQLNDMYYRYFHSTTSNNVTINTTVLALQQMCRYHNIDDVYITGWQQFDFWPEVDLTKVFAQGKKSCADILTLEPMNGDVWDRQNKYIYPNLTHPNQLGHELIAHELYEWIINRDR